MAGVRARGPRWRCCRRPRRSARPAPRTWRRRRRPARARAWSASPGDPTTGAWAPVPASSRLDRRPATVFSRRSASPARSGGIPAKRGWASHPSRNRSRPSSAMRAGGVEVLLPAGRPLGRVLDARGGAEQHEAADRVGAGQRGVQAEAGAHRVADVGGRRRPPRRAGRPPVVEVGRGPRRSRRGRARPRAPSRGRSRGRPPHGPSERPRLGEAVDQHDPGSLDPGARRAGPSRRSWQTGPTRLACATHGRGCARMGARWRRAPEDLQATFCATLVDEWVRRGVAHAVVAPGLPLHADGPGAGRPPGHARPRPPRRAQRRLPRARAWPSAPARRPSCSPRAARPPPSCTRPSSRPTWPRCRCSCAPPTGRRSCRTSARRRRSTRPTSSDGPCAGSTSPGVAEDADGEPVAGAGGQVAGRGRPGPAPGPVHLNLAFREPLLGHDPAPAARAPRARVGAMRRAARRCCWPGRSSPSSTSWPDRRGVFVAGPGLAGPGGPCTSWPPALGWPVIAAPAGAGVGRARRGRPVRSTRCCARRGSATRLRPEVVVRLGTPLASKVVGEWVAASGADEIVVAGPGSLDRPRTAPPTSSSRSIPARSSGAWAAAAADLTPRGRRHWRDAWEEAGHAPAGRRSRPTSPHAAGPTEPGGGPRRRWRRCPTAPSWWSPRRCPCATSSGSPGPRAGVRVHANRGANGIDGVVSTAVGVARGHRPAHRAAHRRHRVPPRLQRPARARQPRRRRSWWWWSTTTAAGSSRSSRRPRRSTATGSSRCSAPRTASTSSPLARAYGVDAQRGRRRRARGAGGARGRGRARARGAHRPRRQRRGARSPAPRRGAALGPSTTAGVDRIGQGRRDGAT